MTEHRRLNRDGAFDGVVGFCMAALAGLLIWFALFLVAFRVISK